MKRLSIKIRLTILYSFFMILVTGAALAVLFSLSSREILASAQARLEHRVQESVEDIRIRNGELRLDSDFYSVTRDVYLSLYDENMYFLYGRIPYGFIGQPEISDGEVRRIREGELEWYVYDMSFNLSDDRTVYVRGITSVTDAEESFSVTVRFALILFPGLALITGIIGYRFTRSTLLPVKRITDTVQRIRADADLSQRIGLDLGRGKNRDEIYNLAETFDGMLGELEEVFRREKQFTSDVSHELRTPVSVILAQCGACLADELLTGEQRSQILLIQRKAKEMSEMISHLLFLSRADQGRQPLNREQVDVSGLTEMVAEEQQMLAEEAGNGVKIVCRIREGITAYVDETFYIRMLINLISNAVYYSGKDCTVTVSLDSDGEWVTGKVADNGIGISKEDLPHIWERFYRADTSRSGSSHSGLGLSMVKWIAQVHGGSVEAESAPGQGSVFTFRLPVKQKNEETEKDENI
ncbi:MAG TPA: HAMP domain-containing protein [Candidatus Mediterraneibacter norfolkensis]|nr:HAMP domain-containing protein [Candidatus Mediterraneibacter norfolkensis]